jgi:ribose transport system substrate-binding protein
MKVSTGRTKRLVAAIASVGLASTVIMTVGVTPASAAACEKSKIKLVQSGRGLENPYYVAVNKGSAAFAKSVGLEHQWISSEGDSQKQLSQITSILAESGNCAVINVDPNESSILPAILDAAKEAGAHVVVQWNRPAGVTPLKYGTTFTSFMSEDGNAQGYAIAVALFKAMKGKGKIVALQGMLDNTVAQSRFKGLKRAMKEYPKIKLLADQTAKWDQNEGQKVMQTMLTKYGKKIKGVWTANDSMGLGALQALKAKKRTDVGVVGIDGLELAMKEIKAGNGKTGFIATTASNAHIQGGYGLAIGYAAATGSWDPAKAKPEERAFYLKTVIATKKNVDAASKDLSIGMKFTDIWDAIGSVIPETA